MCKRRWLAVAVTCAVALSGGMVRASTASATPRQASGPEQASGPGGASGPEEASGARQRALDADTEAVRAARASGERVEVPARRTETRQVFANPDGTFTSETSPQPVRVRRGDGWVPVDTTLRFQPDGSVAPATTKLDIQISGGGTSELARLTDRGRAISMNWPGPLPRPALAGDTATYPEVLPGVDLKVSASALGFSEVLVVKDRTAAANPALRRINFRLRTTGVSTSKTATGGITATDGTGAAVFHSPPPRMWDSSGDGPADTRALAASPRHGSRVATMASELSGNDLAVLPDRGLLDRAVFPLYIDPSFSGGKLAWAMVDKAYPNQEYWNNSHRPEAGFYGGGGVKRSFFRMDTDNVNGKHILSATFRITGEWTYNWSCDVKPKVILYLTGAISSSTNWNKQPSWSTQQDSWSGSLGHEGCAVRPIEFDATNAVTQAASKKWANTTLGLRVPADQEDNLTYWFGFKNDPKLVINYNTVPSVPTGMTTTPGTPCVTGAGRPYLNSTSPKLLAKIYDPDKANDAVRAEFQVHWFNPATNAWEAYGDYRRTSYVSSPDPVTHGVTLPVSNGGAYAWRVKAYDGTDSSGWTKWCEFTVDTTDPASLPQVGSTAYPPDTPDAWHGGIGQPGAFTFAPGPGDTDIAGYRYALGDPNAQLPVTGANVSVQVAPTHDWLNTLYVWPVDRAGNVGTRYTAYDFYVGGATAPVAHWKFDEGSGATVSDAGSAAAAPITLAGGTGWTGGRIARAGAFDGVDDYGTTPGPVLDTGKALSVSAWARITASDRNLTIVSQAGNRASGFQLYYSASYGKWIFNRHATDTDNPTIIRAISEQPPVVGKWTHLLGVYDPTLRELRLYVDGRRQQQTTPASFTTPWKDGSRRSGFFLGNRLWSDGTRAWSFSLVSTDADSGGTWAHATSAEPATLGEWTHLTGVYDYPMGEVRLYVNGQLVDEVPYAFDHWNASGALQVGRAKYKGAAVDYFPGDIDDVRISIGAMTDREVLDTYLAALQ